MASENSVASDTSSPADSPEELREWIESVPENLRPGLLRMLDPDAAQLLAGALGNLKAGKPIDAEAVVDGVLSCRGKIGDEGWRTIARTVLVVGIPFLVNEWQSLTPEATDVVIGKLQSIVPVFLSVVGGVTGHELYRKDR